MAVWAHKFRFLNRTHQKTKQRTTSENNFVKRCTGQEKTVDFSYATIIEKTLIEKKIKQRGHLYVSENGFLQQKSSELQKLHGKYFKKVLKS